MLSRGLQTRLLKKDDSVVPVGEPAVEDRAGAAAKAWLPAAAEAEVLAESPPGFQPQPQSKAAPSGREQPKPPDAGASNESSDSESSSSDSAKDVDEDAPLASLVPAGLAEPMEGPALAVESSSSRSSVLWYSASSSPSSDGACAQQSNSSG